MHWCPARGARERPAEKGRGTVRILDRYVVWEMAMPLLFGIIAFTSIFIGADLVRLVQVVTDYGAPLTTALRLLLLNLPQVLIYTFPMSVLLATLLSLSRLSTHSELVAMQAGGVSPYRIIALIVSVSALITVLTIILGEVVVPKANAEYTRVMVEEVRGGRLPTVTSNVVLTEYEGGVLKGFLYAARFDQVTAAMSNVTLVSLEEGRPVETTFAERVVWGGDAWYMERGVIHRHGRGDEEQTGTMVFQDARRPMTIGYRPEDVVRAQRSPEEMTMRELRAHIDILRSQGADVRRHLVQLHLKVALPAASIVFALVGAPLGMQSHRRAASIGFGLSIVVIFVYYVLMSVGSALGEGGQLPPALGAWLQNILLGAFGIIMILRRGGR